MVALTPWDSSKGVYGSMRADVVGPQDPMVTGWPGRRRAAVVDDGIGQLQWQRLFVGDQLSQSLVGREDRVPLSNKSSPTRIVAIC